MTIDHEWIEFDHPDGNGKYVVCDHCGEYLTNANPWWSKTTTVCIPRGWRI